jgi:hypothetical protein
LSRFESSRCKTSFRSLWKRPFIYRTIQYHTIHYNIILFCSVTYALCTMQYHIILCTVRYMRYIFYHFIARTDLHVWGYVFIDLFFIYNKFSVSMSSF